VNPFCGDRVTINAPREKVWGFLTDPTPLTECAPGLENPQATTRVSLSCMKTYTAVVERSPETGLFVGFIPGFPGAHTQAESLDELNANLREVLAMLLEDGEPQIEAEFVGTQLVQVG
jgi:predicted RNase H-like HicB family nuclease